MPQRPKGWLSHYCNGRRRKGLESREQRLNIEESWFSCFITTCWFSSENIRSVKLDELIQMSINPTVPNCWRTVRIRCCVACRRCEIRDRQLVETVPLRLFLVDNCYRTRAFGHNACCGEQPSWDRLALPGDKVSAHNGRSTPKRR